MVMTAASNPFNIIIENKRRFARRNGREREKFQSNSIKCEIISNAILLLLQLFTTFLWHNWIERLYFG
jgi:hypothetical protein